MANAFGVPIDDLIDRPLVVSGKSHEPTHLPASLEKSKIVKLTVPIPTGMFHGGQVAPFLKMLAAEIDQEGASVAITIEFKSIEFYLYFCDRADIAALMRCFIDGRLLRLAIAEVELIVPHKERSVLLKVIETLRPTPIASCYTKIAANHALTINIDWNSSLRVGIKTTLHATIIGSSKSARTFFITRWNEMFRAFRYHPTA